MQIAVHMYDFKCLFKHHKLNNAEKTTIAPLSIYIIDTLIYSNPYVIIVVANISKIDGMQKMQ